VDEIAATADERQRRELVTTFVYGVIEQELNLSVKEGWRFAEWLLADQADATSDPKVAERLREAVAFVRDCRWYVAKYAPPNSPKRAPRTTRILSVRREGGAPRSRPRARERSPQRRARSGSGSRARPRPSADDDADPASRALARRRLPRASFPTAPSREGGAGRSRE
jgi:hypothetical protein